MLSKLEGTVHVNMALIVKFMQNFFFNPQEYEKVPRRDDAVNDDGLFDQGPTRDPGKIMFHDYSIAYNSVDLPNFEIFKEQIGIFKEFLTNATPDSEQKRDVDYLLTLGEILSWLFTDSLYWKVMNFSRRERTCWTRYSISW